MSDAEQPHANPPGTFFSINPQGNLLEKEASPADRAVSEATLERLREILSTGDRSPSESLSALLELGAEHLGVENAHLVKIDPAQGTHTIVETSGPHPAIEAGDTTELAGTYCRKVVAGQDALAVRNAPEQGWSGDPAYEAYGLATYVGTKVVIDDELYGTVCFVDSEPREEPLGEAEHDFLELLTGAVTREVRRRRRAKHAKRTEARLEVLFDESPDMLAIYDRDGQFRDANPRLLDHTGYDREEFLAMNVWDLAVDYDAEEVRRILREMSPGDRRKLEALHQRKGGATFPVEVHVRHLDVDGEDRFVAISRDISDRKQKQKKVQRLREKYEGLLEGAPDAIFVADAQGQIQEANEAAATLVGTSAENLEGKPLTSVHPAEEAGKYEAIFHRQLQDDRGTETLSQFDDGSQIYVRRENGARIPVEASVRQVELGGEPHVVGIFRDITDRLKRQRQLERLNDLFRKAEELAGIGAWEYHPKTDRLRWTDEVYEIYGLPEDTEVSTEDAIEAFHPEDRPVIKEAFERAVEEGIPYDEEVRLETPEGETRWVRAHGDVQSEEGKATRVLGTIQDITDRKQREQKVREAKEEAEEMGELFRSVVENAPVMIDIVNPDGRIEMVNDHFEAVLGWTQEDLEDHGKEGLWKVLFPDPERRRRVLTAVHETPDEWLDFRPRAKGETRRVDSTWTNVELSDGRTLGIGIDITDRKQRRRRLERYSKYTDRLLNATDDLFCVFDAEGRLQRWNDRLGAVSGYSAEDLHGMSALSLVPESDRERAQAAIAKVLETGRAKLEVRLLTKDGSEIPYELTGNRVEHPDGDLRLVTIGRDVTDRKRRERMLKNTNATLEAVLENLPMGVLTEDTSRQVLAANERLCELFDLPMGPAALEGQDCAEAAAGIADQFAEPEEFPRRIEDILSRGDPVFGEELRLADGRVLERDFVPYEIPEGTASLWVYQDITERKRREETLRKAKEEAEQASRLKSAMLANMNHEIRTPLTSVTGFADLMHEELEGRMKEFAGRIYKSGERLMRTLDSVLQLSKLEAGISEIERKEVDLARLTRETVELLRPSAEEKDVALDTKLPGGPVTGMWNEGALNRIAENLIENAIKFTPEDGTVTVRLREDQEATVLAIEDTGVGIAESAQAEIFEAFQQESEGLGREFEGSGLGLSIVKRLVEAHEGTIEVESEKGVGSCFSVHLPKRPNANK